MSQKWFSQSERGTSSTLSLILWIALHLGRPTTRALLYPISLYFLLTAREQRLASRQYLRRVLGREPAWWHILRHIHTFAATILDRVYLLAGRLHYFNIQIHNARLLLDLVEANSGCILLGAHVGSFEVLRVLAVEHSQIQLKILMYPEHNSTITGLLNSLNPEITKTVIPLGQVDTMLKVRDALSSGEVVGMLGDRAAGEEKLLACHFLGDKATFPTGPAQLAALMQVPVILFLGLYRGNGKYDIHFERLATPATAERGKRERLIRSWTESYAAMLERYVLIAPYNWFNFYDFWDER